jgi:flagellar basal-body rod modification protein FlgD
MTVSPLTATPAAAPAESSSGTTGTSASGTSSILGENEFLKLMVAQLQAQNPLEPGNSNEFVNELAQLTQTEQTTNLANASELSGAVQLIGHKVAYNTASGASATGTVQSVQSSASGTTVTVASSLEGEGVAGITLSSITEVE